MELDSLFSAVTGGGLVLLLAQFIFTRLIHQVDRLADKITKLEILHAKLAEKVTDFNRVEAQLNDSHARIVRLETLVKVGNH